MLMSTRVNKINNDVAISSRSKHIHRPTGLEMTVGTRFAMLASQALQLYQPPSVALLQESAWCRRMWFMGFSLLPWSNLIKM